MADANNLVGSGAGAYASRRRATGKSAVSSTDLRTFLDGLGLAEYFDALHAERIEVRDLSSLTDADLAALGLPLGPRRRLMRAAGESAAQPDVPDGERRNLTVLFCDMVDSTAIASRVDPEELRALYGAFHDACIAAIEAEDGYVAHRLGDGLMAHFGFPRAMEDAAIRAVRAGLDIVGRVGRITSDGETVAVRIGVASGMTVIEQTRPGVAAGDETATGATLSLAARLQALAPPGGVVISDATRRLLRGAFDLEPLGPQRLKGFAEEVEVWRVRNRAARDAPETGDGPLSGPLIGREREFAELRDAWDDSLEGRGGTVVVTGEPGLGKSRLLAELCRDASAEGGVITLRCSRYSQGAAHHPVMEWLGERADPGGVADPEGALARLPGRSSETVSALMAIASGVPRPETPADDALTRQDDIIEAVVALLSTGASGRARLVAVEDVQWADAATLEVLDRLAGRAGNMPLLVVATARPDAGRLPEGPGVRVVALGPLSAGAALDLVTTQAGSAALTEAVRRTIAERSGGVPLFAEELTRSVLETPDADTADVPMTLQDTLMARLDRLEAGKRVAQVGALIGAGFSLELLAACTDLSDAELRHGIDELVAANLIDAHDAGYGFRHALVRDAAYGSLLRSSRVVLHRRVAAVIEADFPALADTIPERLAHHYAKAGEIEAAVRLWEKAAERNIARAAPSSAITCLTSAIALLQRLPDSPSRNAREVVLRQRLNMPLTVLHGFASAVTEENLARLTTLLEAGDPSEAALQLLWSRCMSALVRSDLLSARATALHLRRAVGRATLSNAARMPERMLGYVAMLEGELDLAETHFGRVLDGYDPADLDPILPGHPFDVLASSLAQRAILSALRGRDDAVSADQARALARAAALDSPATSFQVLVHLCLARFELDDHDGVRPLLADLRDLVGRHEISPLYTDLWEAWFHARAGDLDGGLAEMKRAQEAGTQYPLWLPRALLLQADLLIRAGRHEEALRMIADCEERIGRFRHTYLLVAGVGIEPTTRGFSIRCSTN
jgi:class 3 adenylate cyclase/tetratricopeptide (TPR) repeat protein